MEVRTVTTSDNSLLQGIRSTLSGDSDVLLCVAFAHSRGIHLLERELRSARSARLLATTVFGSTEQTALSLAATLEVDVRVLNPGSGTYHPKVYLSTNGTRASAFVGSANLTAGLATNVEAGVIMEGRTSDAPLAELIKWAESQWENGAALLRNVADSSGDDELEPVLLALLERAFPSSSDRVFATLGRANRNRIIELTRSEVLVMTDRSQQPQPIPAWMLNVAWEWLCARGELTNKTLLEDLRVHRSSAVLGMLARLDGVDRVPGATAVRLRTARGRP